MNRREIIAGVGSVGVLGGGAAILWRGLPSFDGDESDRESTNGDEDGTDAAEDADRPIELETLDAPGSEAGTIAVPDADTDVDVTLVMFFSPVCRLCQSLMPEVAEAQDRLADEDAEDVTVVSTTAQSEPDQLREWWADNDGDWTLAYDADRELTEEYDVVTHPVLAAIDADGELRWENDGVIEADRIVREIERVLADVAEESEAGGEADAEDADETDSTGE